MGNKILFLSRLYYPHIGGIEKHIEKISSYLIKKGYKITLITTKYQDSLSDVEIYKNTDIIRFKQPNIKFLGIIYTWIWFIKNIKLIRDCDIVHIHDVFIWYWPLKLIFPRKKVYITYHGQWGDYPIRKTDIFQKRIGAIFSDGVIAIGDYIPKNYKIRTDYVSYGAVDIPEKLSVKKDNKTWLYVGRLDRNTGLPLFLKLLKKIKSVKAYKDFKVIFCGDGKLKNKCQEFGQVLGWTNPEKYYKKAKYLYSSGYLTILEGMINKCVVFCGYQNSLQKDYYMNTPFKDFINCSDSADSLYKKIKSDPFYNKLVNGGYEWAKKQNWEKLTEIYLNLWNKK